VRERNKKVRAEGWGDEELVEAFVAIDDRALLQERGGDRLHGHFVMTHPYVPPIPASPLFMAHALLANLTASESGPRVSWTGHSRVALEHPPTSQRYV